MSTVMTGSMALDWMAMMVEPYLWLDDGQGSFGVVPNFASGWADGFVAESFAGSEGDGIDINRDIGLRCYRYNCRWYVNGFMNAQSPNSLPNPDHERHYAEGSLSHPPIKDPYI